MQIPGLKKGLPVDVARDVGPVLLPVPRAFT
jgi:hypothetical protein